MGRLHGLCCSIVLLCTLSGEMATSDAGEHNVISVEELSELMKDGKVKLVDAAFAVGPKPDWKAYKNDYYGQFNKSMATFKQESYVKEHIHGATLFNLDIGMYVGEFQRFALYPPELFEQYVRKLGISDGDHVVIYGRGPFSGMLFAAKVWWLLKYYGLKNVQILNGGLEAWKRAGHSVDNDPVVVQEGNFHAKVNPKMLVTFEDLEAKGPDGKALIDELSAINVFDSRKHEEYDGTIPSSFESSGPITGFHIKGAKNLASTSVVDENGLKNRSALKDEINKSGYKTGKETITYCAVGIQASLVELALTEAGIKNVKQYHGGLTEMALRDPSKISGK